MSSHGLPCSHKLKKLEEERRSLLLEHFHPHWHLKRDEAQPRPILEPRRAIDRLGQKRTQPVTSTRREPSGFEMVGPSKRAPSKCSRCHTLGHMMTSRDCPLRFKDLLAPTAQTPDPAPSKNATPTLALSTITANSTAGDPVNSPATLPDTVMEAPAGACQRSPSIVPPLPIRVPALATPVAPSSPVMTAPPAQAFPNPTREGPLPEEVPLPLVLHLQSPPRYDSPEAIYARYVAARNEWYAAQPAGTIKTNQQFRKAVGLLLRYDKQSYKWCLDYKQMSKRCVTAIGSREWTKEEMMSYLDWSKTEDERVEVLVAKEMGDNPLGGKRRGVKDIWKSAEKDSKEQQALHSTDEKVGQCIIVKP